MAILLIDKIKQKNNGTFKLVDAADINWDGFDLPNSTDVETLKSYFQDGKAKIAVNAEQLGGHDVSYFATAEALNNVVNGLTWREPVATVDELKAITTPQEGWTVSVADTNKIYRFDDASVAEENGDTIIKPTDATPGAWVLLGTVVYSKATQSTDGLMSAADKTKLDGLSNTSGTFYATTPITAESDVATANITVPAGFSLKVGDTVIDNTGKQFTITSLGEGTVHVGTEGFGFATQTSVTAIATTVENKVDKEEGKGLSTNDFTTAFLNKLNAIAENATKTAKSTTNGNILINDSETVVYTHPTDPGNLHIPAGGAVNQTLQYGGTSGTAIWGDPKTIVKVGASAPEDLVEKELFFKLLD